jgi:hypothetical protein
MRALVLVLTGAVQLLTNNTVSLKSDCADLFPDLWVRRG